MRRLALAPVLLVVLAGCSSARSRSAPAAVAPSAIAARPPEVLPFAVDPPRGREPVPLSIQRLLSEEQSEIHDVLVLAGPVGDERGRARAAREVSTLADELRDIEASLRGPVTDSGHLDEVVVKLQRLATRIGILHEALRAATGPTNAVEIEIGK